MTNKTGINPVGHRVLVLPDTVEKTSKGGIILTDDVRERDQAASESGLVVDIGPEAWNLETQKEPWAKIGDKVCFARYAGKVIKGIDGKEYRLMNDEDILAEIKD